MHLTQSSARAHWRKLQDAGAELDAMEQAQIVAGANHAAWEAQCATLQAALHQAQQEREQLRTALEGITPPMPGKDARCHAGLCSQEECCHCSRIKAARAALAAVQSGGEAQRLNRAAGLTVFNPTVLSLVKAALHETSQA